MQAKSLYVLPLVAALVSAFTLTACEKRLDGTTIGQKVDSTVAKVEQKTANAVARVEQKTEQAVDATSTKMKDAAITTSINAELARDTALSALKIDVDTKAGRVALKGTAPDSQARDRATQLAQKVDGVVGVDNQLVVKSN